MAEAAAMHADVLATQAAILARPAGRERRMADAVRAFAIDAAEAAKSAHAGMPLGMADAATVLWTRFLKFDAADPRWPDRDRFVLSAGHGSMLLYALLHLTGHAGMDLDALRRFRTLRSPAAGLPEFGAHPAIETSAGPLGQGFAAAVGMALAERMMAARFGRSLVDHRTWVIAAEGDLMEGVSHEAASLAGHLRLGRLTVLYDRNFMSVDGPVSLASSEDPLRRFAAYGWAVKEVDGHDPADIAAALSFAVRSARADPDRLPHHHRLRRAHQGGQRRRCIASRSGRARRSVPRRRWAGICCRSSCPRRSAPPGVPPASAGAIARRAWLKRLARHPQRAEFERVIAGRLPERWHERLAALKAGLAETPPGDADPGGELRRARRARARRCRSCAAARPTAPARAAPSPPAWPGGAGGLSAAATSISARASTAWRRASTAWRCMAACCPSAPRSSPSPTACARRCASPR